jgi:hypothetical protein
LYGQGIWGLARQIKGTPIEARELQDHHRKQYREYWAWIEKTLNLATYTQQMQTTFGWLLKIGENDNLRAMQKLVDAVQCGGHAENCHQSCSKSRGGSLRPRDRQLLAGADLNAERRQIRAEKAAAKATTTDADPVQTPGASR